MVISHVTIITDSALCFNAVLGAILRVMRQLFHNNKENLRTSMYYILYINFIFDVFNYKSSNILHEQ